MIGDATLGALAIQAPISFSGVGDNTVVSGLQGQIVKVLQLFLVCGSTTNLTFKSGSTALSGALAMLANGSMVLDYIQLPLQCLTGDSFIINSSAGSVGGTIWFIQQP